jgi:hypothetical protein
MYTLAYEPTQDELAEASFHFARMEYEQRPFTVRCKACQRFATDSQQQLERSGWTLTIHGEWCPKDQPDGVPGIRDR